MSSILRPWVFVLTGIVFNILSAVITHYFIGQNNERVAELDRMINNRQILIDGLWQSKIETERKKELFILYFANKPGNSTPPDLLDRYFQEYLLETSQTYEFKEIENRLSQPESGNIELLLELSDAVETYIIDSINDSYFEKTDLEDNKMPIEQGNATLFSIAIFLQVIGLILILAKDIKRN